MLSLKHSGMFLLALVAIQAAPVAADVSMLVYNQPGLNGEPGTCESESANLLSICQHAIENSPMTIGSATFDYSGYSLDDLTGFNDPELTSKLDAATFFFMTDMEGSLSGWDTTSQAVVRDFIAGGGIMLMTGTSGSRDSTFINEITGYDTSSTYCPGGAVMAESTSGTAFENGPATLDCPSATDGISCGTAECTPYWGTTESNLVSKIPFGDGAIIYVGWDFYSSGQVISGLISDGMGGMMPHVSETCDNSDSAFVDVLVLALQVASEAAPTAAVTDAVVTKKLPFVFALASYGTWNKITTGLKVSTNAADYPGLNAAVAAGILANPFGDYDKDGIANVVDPDADGNAVPDCEDDSVSTDEETAGGCGTGEIKVSTKLADYPGLSGSANGQDILDNPGGDYDKDGKMNGVDADADGNGAIDTTNAQISTTADRVQIADVDEPQRQQDVAPEAEPLAVAEAVKSTEKSKGANKAKKAKGSARALAADSQSGAAPASSVVAIAALAAGLAFVAIAKSTTQKATGHSESQPMLGIVAKGNLPSSILV